MIEQITRLTGIAKEQYMKHLRDLLEKRWFAYTFAACVAVLFYLVLSHIGLFFYALRTFVGYLKPVIGGIVIAYVLNPLMKFYENRVCDGIGRASVRRSLSLFLAVISVLIVVVLLLIVLIPQIIDSVATLLENINGYVGNLESWTNSIYAGISSINLDLTHVMESITDSLAGFLRSLPGRVGGIISTSYSIGAGFASFIVSCILAIYFLADKERIKNGMRRLLKALLPEQSYRNSVDFWKRCNGILLRYIGGDLLDGLVVAIVNWVFMLIMRMPYGVLISVIVGITNLAPTFGPIVGCVIGALILLLINPWHALWFIIFTIVLQTIDGYIIKPRLFGSALGVSSVMILIFLIIGGRMFGVIGILLAIPCAAIFDYVYLDLVIRRIEVHRMETDRARRIQQREEQ